MAAKPSKIGKYDVIEVIGRGGMGIVYKATDPHLSRLVAIKMMTGAYSDNPDLLKRFYREAQSTGNLQHPNIVTVYDLGDLEGNPYLVMEYLEGESLDAVIHSRQPLTLVAKINLICEVCQGLSYAHHHGIVHRDIKPGNVMVLKNGGIKIVDFGIAHIGDRTVTRTGQLIGSLGYMSPEQVNGKPVDTRTDIFSTGVVLYQFLTYALPFDGDSTAATLLKIIHDPPPSLKKFMTEIPSELEDVIFRALAKDREERYRTVEDFGFDLAQIRDRLKQGLVEGHLRQAESLFSSGLTHKAKELLLEVLKIDRQHTGAIRLFRAVQQSIEEEQIGVQIRQLRGQAEEAYVNQQFEVALNYVDKALNLHRTDTDLQSLRESIQQARTQAERLQNLLHQAEVAHQEGDLDIAKKMLEETLELAPNDLQAKALYRVIHREWAERSRRSQVDNLLDSARKEIASRRFTGALDVLKEAEALDPNGPEVKSLIASANAGREQERQRRELEAINRQIEEALDRDDFITACQRIDQGLLKFPEDRALAKLKSLTEKQRQVSERKQFIDEQLAQARALIQAGQNEDVLQLLDRALARVGPDPHLQSLRVIVRETVERERTEKRKGEYLQRAKECLRRKEFTEAINALESAGAEFTNDPDIGDLLQFANEEAAADKRRRMAEAAADKARALIENDEYDQAVQLLETSLRDSPEEELRIALAQARDGAAEYHKRLEGALSASKKLLLNRKPAEATRFLEAQPSSFSRNQAYNELLEQARRESERWQSIDRVIEQSRRLSDQRNFDDAFRSLEQCRRNWGDTPELQSATAELQRCRAADATEKLGLIMADGRMLMMAKEYRAVLDRLKPARELAAIVAANLRKEFESLQAQAATALVQQRKVQVEQLLLKGEHLQAADLLRGSQTEFPDDRVLSDLKKRLDEAENRRVEVQRLLNTARKLFSESSWKDGGQACIRAISLAVRDPWLREQAIDVVLRAADSAVETDWRSAESLLSELTAVQGGITVSGSLRARIAAKKRAQVIQDAKSEAHRLQSAGDLQNALKIIEESLASLGDDPNLKARQAELQQLQREQEERARLEEERLQRLEYLKAVREQLGRDPALEPRIRILEEALHAYPDEISLQQELANVRELKQRVASRVLKAKDLEDSRHYGEAIEAWEEIESLGSHFSEAETSLVRLHGLREQELATERAALIERAQTALSAFDLGQVSDILVQAQKQFEDDPQILRLKKALQEQRERRADALTLIAESKRFFEKRKWSDGGQAVQKATEIVPTDVLVRRQAVSALLRAAESALPLDWQAAENLIYVAECQDPSDSQLATIRGSVESRKREAIVTQHLTSTQTLESAGDLDGALTRLELGLREYPDDPQLLKRKEVLESQSRTVEAAKQKEKQITEHEEFAQRQRSAGNFQGSLARLKQGLLEYPDEPRLLQLKTAVEKAMAEAEQLKQREQDRKRQKEERQRLRAEQKTREEARKKRERAEALYREQEKEREEKSPKQAEDNELRDGEILDKKEAPALAAIFPRPEPVRELSSASEQSTIVSPNEAVTRPVVQPAFEGNAALTPPVIPVGQSSPEVSAETHRTPKESRSAAKLWLSASALLVVIMISVASWSFLNRPGTLVVRNGIPGTIVQVDKATHTIAQDGSVAFQLKPGSHVIELARDGYQPRELQINIVSGREFALNNPALQPVTLSSRSLTPKEGQSNGTLVIETGNKDVRVFIDNVKQQNTRRGVLRLSLSPTEYDIRAERPGYVTRSLGVQISSNAEQQIDLRLEREAGISPHARLLIRAAVPGSQVFVDGDKSGTVGRNGTFSSDVSDGDHDVFLMVEKQQSNTLRRHFAPGSELQLGGPEFKLGPPVKDAEDTAWLQLRDSHSINALEGFLESFPSSKHRPEAEAKLEDLYWTKASDSNSIADFRDYQSRYPKGRYSQDAQGDITKLDWQQAQNTSDTRVLEEFVKKYTSGTYHDQAAAKLDDLAWQRANRANDAGTLQDYLSRFPNGKHAEQARKGLDELTMSKPPARLDAVDDRTAVLGVLQQYKKAYQDQSVNELRTIWPSISARQISNVEVFFRTARSVSLAYNLMGEPETNGSSSTLTFTQSLNFLINGKQQRNSAKVTMQLKKAAPGTWFIESIR